jgi:hypothetical protein
VLSGGRMIAMTQGGSTANHNGNLLEYQIVALLHSKGYHQDQQHKGYVRQYRRYENAYSVKWALDFFITPSERFHKGLAIETKWQSSVGSADEKLMFAVASLLALPCPGVLILGGDGARAGAIRWCLNQGVIHQNLTYHRNYQLH